MNADLRKVYESYKKIHRFYHSDESVSEDAQKEIEAKVDKLNAEIVQIEKHMPFTIRVQTWSHRSATAEIQINIDGRFETAVTIYLRTFNDIVPQFNWGGWGSQDAVICDAFADAMKFATNFAVTFKSDFRKEFGYH